MGTGDNEVNSQVIKLLTKLDMKQLSPHDIVHHHILPVLSSSQWQVSCALEFELKLQACDAKVWWWSFSAARC
jgi:hypothetical protein